jgi:hypothetical protein
MAKVIGMDIAGVLTIERLAEIQESNKGIVDEACGLYEWRKEEQCQRKVSSAFGCFYESQCETDELYTEKFD